jgi:hypothetical protein
VKKLSPVLMMSAAVFLLLDGTSAFAKRTPRVTHKTKFQAVLSLSPGYRSNVFKAPPAIKSKSDNLNLGGLQLTIDHRFNRSVSMEFSPQLDFEKYAKYAQRDQFNYGVHFETSWRISKSWRLRGQAETGKSKRDLVDDNGEFSGRTLGKWLTKLTPDLRYSNRGVRAEFSYERQLTNYDESADSLGKHLTSYDYDQHSLQIDLHVNAPEWLETRVVYSMDWRDYRERKTLAIDKKSSRPRQFTEKTVAPELTIKFKRIQPFVRYSFTHRKETYQNFYGYDYRKYRVGFDAKLPKDIEVALSFSYEEKKYPNYWSSRIGSAHRVYVLYRDWQADAKYPLSPNVDLLTEIHWYNKTSNDFKFAYRQLTFVLGAELRFSTP